MFILPPPLGALGGYRQFVLYQLVPSVTRVGKTDKFPINPRTFKRHDAHDPSIWLDVNDAAAFAVAAGEGFGVGFVFTPADPFFFVDIDSCLEDGQWSVAANALLQRFNGAAVEISASGRGLHIIGCGDAGPPPPARKVKYGQWFDLYTENRFVALTGTGALGDASTDHTPALKALVAEFLQPEPGTTAAEWTDRPRSDWNGPVDDAELIRRAMASQSGPQAFGKRASFADLYMADGDKLRQFYPDPARTEGYDASQADSALAQSLAFWTGNDCERIRRIMHTSALKRDKWEREDYLPRTILGCVARQYDTIIDKKLEIAVTPTGTATVVEQRGETFLSLDMQADLFKGCVYIRPRHKILVPGGVMVKPDQFRVTFGGYCFPMDVNNERVSRNAFEAFTESLMFRAPRADGITFRPDRPPAELIEDAGWLLANVWWPIETARMEGDAAPFLTHLAKLYPDEGDRAKLLAYLAAVVQHPGVKFQWAPLIQGVEGNGKTFIVTAIARAVGERYSHLPNAQDFTGNGGKFTGWLEQKLFIGVEEIYAADRREIMDILKPMITNSRIEIQAKGMDQVTGDNRANFIVCSNHKDAIPKTLDDRRWGIFYCAQQKRDDLRRDGMDGDYMVQLWDWALKRDGFAIINNFLRTYKIPDVLNPAVLAHRAPETTSSAEAIGLSLGGIEQEIVEAIEQELPGFAGGWVSSMMLDKLLQRIGAERRVPPRRRRELMEALGYFWHPIFPEGRTPTTVQPDGGRPKLFAKKGHPVNAIASVPMALRKYTEAQTLAATQKANFGIDGTGNKA
jgi:hypothetical protein